MKGLVFGATMILLAGCATPYQEMGMLGGVQATQIASDTLQVTARGNGFTDPDTIQRFALRKAAESTLAAGYDLFYIGADADRSRTGTNIAGYASGGYNYAWLTSTTWQTVKPGQTLTVKMMKYPAPSALPPGMYDARDVLKFAMTGGYVPPAAK